MYRKYTYSYSGILVSISLMLICCGGKTSSFEKNFPEKYTPDSDVWTGAYLAAWHHDVSGAEESDFNHMPTEEIDWNAFSHLYYFHLIPNADGTLSGIEEIDYIREEGIRSIISAAHQNEKPVLFTIGGWGYYEAFSSAIRPENRDLFISNLVSTMNVWGFDGIDINMEPIHTHDVDNYIAFADQLHQELQKHVTPLGYYPILTAATHWQEEMFALLVDKFDQINIMTYDYSGAWDGWVSWHNSPLYNGGYTFPGELRQLPSADGDVKKFLNAGIPPEKLGIGTVFEGYIWEGEVFAPLQDWISQPDVTSNVPYYRIMRNYYSEDAVHWDHEAGAAYLSIIGLDITNNMFISYDNERSVREKFRYVRANNLGGLIIWELGSGYDPNLPNGQKNPLLDAVKNERSGH